MKGARARPPAEGGRPDEAARLTATPFRLFVESVKEYAIFMLDPEGHIATWNLGAERIKGYAASEIIGKHFSVFYTEEDRARRHPQEELAVAAEVGQYAEEGWRIRKDGTHFWASVVLTAVHDETGRLIGFGKVTRDMTERKRQEADERALMQERAARAEAEAANRAKSQFLATMSHELRTPLNAIIGYLDLMELGVHGPLTDDQRHSVERIRRSSHFLNSLINDVLNFARLEAGRVEYRVREVELAPVTAEVGALVLPQFQQRDITFTTAGCQPQLTVWADADKLQQILLNLLTNAYKFTDAGGRVRLECEAGADAVAIRVRDTGRGIPEDRHESVFEPFVQIDRDLVHQSQQGVGLGLAISRELAREMGGDLVLESEVGHGTTFTLTLPRRPPEDPSR